MTLKRLCKFYFKLEVKFKIADTGVVKLILLLGASGRLGRSIQAELTARRVPFLYPSKDELNIFDYQAVDQFVSNHKIDLVVHCASLLTPRMASVTQAKIDAENASLMDQNIFKLVEKRHLQLLFISTSLIYPSQSHQAWSEIDFGTFPKPPIDREYYAKMKYESTRKVVGLGSRGLNCSAIVLPNLLAGPIPGIDRYDQLCEKLFKLTQDASASGEQSIAFNVAINPQLQLVAGFEIAQWLGFVISQELDLPPLLNLSSSYSATPFELLAEMINQRYSGLSIITEGVRQQTLSYSLNDSYARDSFQWFGGQSLSGSVDIWLTEILHGKK